MKLEYDAWLAMWFVQYTARDGTLHRRWFQTEETARKWLDSMKGK